MSYINFYSNNIQKEEKKKEEKLKKIEELKKQKQKLEGKLIIKIMTYLNGFQIEKSRRVCTYWNKAINSYTLWNSEMKHKYHEENNFYFLVNKEKSETTNDLEKGKYTRYLFSFRQHSENMIEKGEIKVLKKYDQKDLKILLTKNINENKFHEDLNFSIKEIEEYSKIQKQIKKTTFGYVDVINEQNKSEKANETWIENGFHIRSVVLIDEQLCIDTKIYQTKNKEAYIKRVSNEIMTLPKYNFPVLNDDNFIEQWVSEVIDYSSELSKVDYSVNNIIGK
jgi:hypothetical protein